MSDINDNKRCNQDSAELLARRLQSMLDEDWKAGEDGSPLASEQPSQASVVQSAESTQQPNRRQPQASVPQEAGKKRTFLPNDGMLLLHDLVYILAIVVIIFTFFVRLSKVEGDSMNPTLVNQDRMLLLSSVWYQKPERGDIVVARIPSFSKDPIVKRVIAVEGDTVDIDFENGIVYVNKEALEEPYISELTYRQFYDEGMTFPVTIEKNHVFLMGDNRNESYDSRYASIGQVDQRCILGKAILLAFPGRNSTTGNWDLSRFGLVK